MLNEYVSPEQLPVIVMIMMALRMMNNTLVGNVWTKLVVVGLQEVCRNR
jgi:hypothetical protein